MKTKLLSSLVVLCAATAAHASQAYVAPIVQKQMLEAAKFPVLVMLKAKADLSGAALLTTKEAKGKFVYSTLVKTANETQADLVSFLNDKHADYERFYSVNMVAVHNANADLIREIAARQDVEEIIGNQTVRPVPERQAERFSKFQAAGVEESIKSTGATRVWEELHHQGEGIVIAGQDTGVQWDHPALKSHYRGTTATGVDHNYNWYDAIQRRIETATNPCGVASKVPCDDHGHGTHTIGTVVGDDGAGNQIGMAPKAQWIACRNMDNGTGRPTTYIRCFEFFLAPFPMDGNPFTDGKPELAPHVINNSWGCDASEGCTGKEMVQTLAALKAAGIMTVVSAGNDGPGCSTIKSQAATISDSTLSVGAHNHRTGTIASFSSRGPSTFDNQVGPDVTAPGVSIRSSVPGGRYESAQWSGTSMAGPHVVGEVALILSTNPSLIGKVDTVFDVIRSTAQAKTSTQKCGDLDGTAVPNNTYGHGLINVYDAAARALSL